MSLENLASFESLESPSVGGELKQNFQFNSYMGELYARSCLKVTLLVNQIHFFLRKNIKIARVTVIIRPIAKGYP